MQRPGDGYQNGVATATKRPQTTRASRSDVRTELIGKFRKNQLLVYASATAYQVLSAIVPFLLFGLGLLGFLHFQDVWTKHLAPDLRPNVSAAGFAVISTTVNKVLHQRQLFWVTAGLALAIWQVSGGIRVIMRGLDVIYGVRDRRPARTRMLVSLGLAVVVGALILAAIAVVWLGPLAYGKVHGVAAALLFVARWGLAAVLLGLAVGLIDRCAPDGRQPVGWVSFGTLLMVGGWILASIVFGLWLRFVASPGSLFGALATFVVLLAYIYLSTTVFFAGAQLDAIVRRRIEGNSQGR